MTDDSRQLALFESEEVWEADFQPEWLDKLPEPWRTRWHEFLEGRRTRIWEWGDQLPQPEEN